MLRLLSAILCAGALAPATLAQDHDLTCPVGYLKGLVETVDAAPRWNGAAPTPAPDDPLAALDHLLFEQAAAGPGARASAGERISAYYAAAMVAACLDRPQLLDRARRELSGLADEPASSAMEEGRRVIAEAALAELSLFEGLTHPAAAEADWESEPCADAPARAVECLDRQARLALDLGWRAYAARDAIAAGEPRVYVAHLDGLTAGLQAIGEGTAQPADLYSGAVVDGAVSAVELSAARTGVRHVFDLVRLRLERRPGWTVSDAEFAALARLDPGGLRSSCLRFPAGPCSPDGRSRLEPDAHDVAYAGYLSAYWAEIAADQPRWAPSYAESPFGFAVFHASGVRLELTARGAGGCPQSVRARQWTALVDPLLPVELRIETQCSAAPN